jgi:hypothetical protein
MITVEIKLLQLRFQDYKIKKVEETSKDRTFSGNVYLDDIRTFTSP